MLVAGVTIPVPQGFDDLEAFVRDAYKKMSDGLSVDHDNRLAHQEDSRFAAGDQWDYTVRQMREANKLPCLTINRLPAYIAQVVGNRRLNKTSIRVTPAAGGTREEAELREGLIRNIERVSNAQRAYTRAFQSAVIGGIGHFSVSVDYAAGDVFDQDIRINSIPNALSVVWDADSRDPTGADARFCFVVDRMTKFAYEQAFGEPPEAAGAGVPLDNAMVDTGGLYDNDPDTVPVVSYWRVIYKPRQLALMGDGTVLDTTDLQPDEWIDNVQLDEATGAPRVRVRQRAYAQLHVLVGNEVIEGPYELPISRVPVFRVPGYEIDTGYGVSRFGIVRHAKDSQRMHNYWRSAIAEKLQRAPKQEWLAADTAVEGRQDAFRNSHVTLDNLLVWNAESGLQPQRMAPATVEPALLEQSASSVQDMRDITNLHEASFGQSSNEVSGKAIMARQAVGELGTFAYTDNLNMAIEEAGKVINDLLPVVYDTERVIVVLGAEDDEDAPREVRINGDAGPDITAAKYNIAVSVGPSAQTQRMAAEEGMLNMVNAMPQTMAVVADQIIEAQSWPGADKIAKRLRKALPPGMAEPDPEDLTPQQQQAIAEQQQKQQQLEQMQIQSARLDMAKKEAEVALALAKGRREVAEAQALAADYAIDQQRVALEAAELYADILHTAERNAAEALATTRSLMTPEKDPL